MAVIAAIGGTSGRGKEGLREVDLNKVPTWPESIGRPVRDKKETVRAGLQSTE